MATIGDIAVKVTADTKQAITGMRQFASETEQAMDKVDSQTSRMSAMGQKMSGIGRSMTMGVTLPIVAGLGAVAVAAAGEEKEMAILEQTLRNNTGATREQVAAVEEWITKTQNATAIADGELRPALGALVAVTKDTGKAQELLGTAMDLATAKGTSVSSMAEAIAKAYNGNIGILSRYGIATKDAAGNALTFDQIMQNAAETFGGTTAAAADTAAGKMAKLKNSFADLTESLGDVLLPVVGAVTDMLDGLMGILNALPGQLKGVAIGGLAVVAAIGPLLWMAGGIANGITAINSAMTLFGGAAKLAAAGQWLLNTALLASPITWIVLGVMAIIAVFVLLWTKCEWFRNFWKGLWGGIKDAFWAVVNFIREHWKKMVAGLAGSFAPAVAFILGHLDDIKRAAGEVAGFLGDVFWGAARAIKAAFTWLEDQVNVIWNKMKDVPVLGQVLDIAENTAGALWNLATGDSAGLAGNANAIVGNLPSFAGGGIASGPRSGYPVMLHGTEVVTPVENAGGVTVMVTGNTFVGNSRDAAVAITDLVTGELGKRVNRGTRGRYTNG